MPVTGSAPQICAIEQATLAAGSQDNFRTLAGNLLQIDTLVDPRTLAANAATAQIEFAAVCNFPHRIRLESENNGLWQTDGSMNQPAEGFAYALPYQAALTWGEVNGVLSADANVRRISERRFNIDQATAGAIELSITIEPGASNTRANAPVLAGYYGDTLRIFLEPR
ncbi:hypothetical protein FSZ31_00425 [Sphingorhabdus soli]|uniref:Uncharacterized protein n=1 Tax=Flavisphingopyxis soli TaxID=2601267 RepID=A0A5C6UKA7_9SPHN|nr:hypothetical protein [Sphingorhabdus soli]TXC73267.1 hypothetical protein FSZ31_00425 [Sphingorhabdus soli]